MVTKQTLQLERINENTARVRFLNGMDVYMFPAHLQFGDAGFQPKLMRKANGSWGEVTTRYKRLHGGFGLKYFKPVEQKQLIEMKKLLTMTILIVACLMMGCSGWASTSASSTNSNVQPKVDLGELYKDCKNFGTIKSCQDYIKETEFNDEKLKTMRDADIRIITENRKQAKMRLDQSIRERNIIIAEYKGATPTPTPTITPTPKPSQTKR